MLIRTSRTAALATLGAGLLAVLVAWLAVGAHGPLSAGLGTAIVLVFFGMGSLPLLVVGEGRNGLAWIVLGLGYVLRILVGVVVWAVAVSSDAIDRKAVGLTVIGCALVWLNTQLLLGLSRRHRAPLDV
ncbi:MAG: synthase protein [Frankiales bacterium]|nr:synthase protein [Frankiales bacterium]MCW2707603.1 synthase protein [Frankiales bacterium]MDX6219779.1 synthase protein [Frankiales bacterium]